MFQRRTSSKLSVRGAAIALLVVLGVLCGVWLLLNQISASSPRQAHIRPVLGSVLSTDTMSATEAQIADAMANGYVKVLQIPLPSSYNQEIISQGNGERPQKGQTMSMHYTDISCSSHFPLAHLITNPYRWEQV